MIINFQYEDGSPAHIGWDSVEHWPTKGEEVRFDYGRGLHEVVKVRHSGRLNVTCYVKKVEQ